MERLIIVKYSIKEEYFCFHCHIYFTESTYKVLKDQNWKFYEFVIVDK